jgi:hypothetical protein
MGNRMLAMSDMSAYHQLTPEQKKRRFRELVKDDRICNGSRFAEEFEQPLLPFNEFKTRESAVRPSSTAPRSRRTRAGRAGVQ